MCILSVGTSAYESGGAGTVYIEDLNATATASDHKELRIDNNGIAYPHEPIHSAGALRNLSDGDYSDISEIGGVTWLYDPEQKYQFDVVFIGGNSHVAILSNTSSEVADVRIGQLMGDRSGMIHAGRKQTFGYTRVNVYLPVNVMAYR